MLQYTQFTPVRLWVVTTTVTRTNERVAGITPVNPIEISPNFILSAFSIRVVSKVGFTINAIRVYGAVGVPNGGNPNAFPIAGAASEALWTTVSNPAVATGLTRQITVLDADAGNKFPPGIVPNFILLEYSATAGSSLNFEVYGTFIGPMIGGVA